MENQSKYDFSKMHIDLSRLSKGQSFLELFPQLEYYESFKSSTEQEIKIAAFMCDPNCIPFSKIKSFELRLSSVFDYLKLDHDNLDRDLYLSVLNLSNENIPKIWTDYLSDMFNHEYVSWFSNSIMYYQMMEQLRKPVEMGSGFDKAWATRINIEKRADEVYKKMKAMESKIFFDDAIRQKTAEAERNKIENYPEKFAQENSVI
jgi:hypothetical protein